MAILVLLIGAGFVVSAQSLPGSAPTTQILAALRALQASADALGSVAESSVRTTPAAGFNTDGLCIVTNVSSEPRHIKIEMVNFNNGDIIAAFESADPSFPGMGRSIGPPYSAGAAYGTREDIRGSLTIVNTPEGGSKIVVPAE